MGFWSPICLSANKRGGGVQGLRYGLTFGVTGRVSHAADHNLTTAQAVAGVRVRQAALPIQLDGLHHLKCI